MDGVLGLILDTLDDIGLSDVVNVIVTADHGMADVDLHSKVSLGGELGPNTWAINTAGYALDIKYDSLKRKSKTKWS